LLDAAAAADDDDDDDITVQSSHGKHTTLCSSFVTCASISLTT